jgi:hypothetical protein
VDFSLAGGELEDGKAVVGVAGEFLPDGGIEGEARIEAREVGDGGDEGRVECADFFFTGRYAAGGGTPKAG